MELKPGYKQTEVGVIPEDWEASTIGSVACINVGRDLREDCFSSFPDSVHQYPVYSNTVENYGLYGFYSVAEYNGDSVTVVGRGVGLGTAFARRGGYGAIGRLIVLFPNSTSDSRYLAAYINGNVTIFHESSGIPQLTGVQVSKYKIAVPPLEEQRAIATALSDADTLLAKLDALITKKRDLKQAAMQQLLTGQTRLPGFNKNKGFIKTEVGVIPEEWEVFSISDVIKNFQNGFAFASYGYVKSGIPIVTMAQIGLDGCFRFREENVNFWPPREASKLAAFQLFRGDIIIAMTDVTPEKNLIGRMSEVTEDGPLLLNQRVGLIRPDPEKIDPYFLRAVSNSRKWRDYARAVASLGVQANIGTKEIRAGKLPVPPLPEQRAIAEVLSDMDAEIVALETRRDKTCALKQGMMQELLTGRIRLV